MCRLRGAARDCSERLDFVRKLQMFPDRARARAARRPRQRDLAGHDRHAAAAALLDDVIPLLCAITVQPFAPSEGK
jgi:hypothetical protein